MSRVPFLPSLVLPVLMLSSCERPAETGDAAAERAEIELLREIAELEARERALEQQIEAERLQTARKELDREREALAADRAALEADEPAAALEADEPAPNEVPAAELVATERVPVSSDDFSVFYDQLEAHGDWFETPDYGHVFRPQVATDDEWRPYLNGRWVHSDQGWTWASEEPFGWATYHYGRWALSSPHGWVWIPGDEWAPAWVAWRNSDDYVGWAPLPPETLYDEEVVYDSSIDDHYGVAPNHYNFVPVDHFDAPVVDHYLPPVRNVTIIHETVNVTRLIVRPRRVYCGGPDPDWWHRRTGRRFHHYDLDFHHRPLAYGRGHRFGERRLECYAPRVGAPWNPRLRPARVADRWDRLAIERGGSGVDPRVRNRFRELRERRHQRAEESVRDGLGRLALQRREVAVALQERRARLAGSREAATGGDASRPGRFGRHRTEATPEIASEAPARRESERDTGRLAQLRETLAERRKALERRREEVAADAPRAQASAPPATRIRERDDSGDRMAQLRETLAAQRNALERRREQARSEPSQTPREAETPPPVAQAPEPTERPLPPGVSRSPGQNEFQRRLRERLAGGATPEQRPAQPTARRTEDSRPERNEARSTPGRSRPAAEAPASTPERGGASGNGRMAQAREAAARMLEARREALRQAQARTGNRPPAAATERAEPPESRGGALRQRLQQQAAERAREAQAQRAAREAAQRQNAERAAAEREQAARAEREAAQRQQAAQAAAQRQRAAQEAAAQRQRAAQEAARRQRAGQEAAQRQRAAQEAAQRQRAAQQAAQRQRAAQEAARRQHAAKQAAQQQRLREMQQQAARRQQTQGGGRMQQAAQRMREAIQQRRQQQPQRPRGGRRIQRQRGR